MEVSDSALNNTIEVLEQAAIAQCDWNVSLEHPFTKFFVGIRGNGRNSSFYDVKQRGDEIYAEGSMDIELTVNGDKLIYKSTNIETSFVAPTYEFSHSCPAVTIDLSCTGNIFVMADSKGFVTVNNSKTGDILRYLDGHMLDVHKVRFFPSGLVVLTAGMDLTVRVWSVENGDCVRVFKGHRQPVTDLGFIGVGKEVLSCASDGTVRKWSCGEGKEVYCWDFESGPCLSMCVGSDHISNLFAVCCEYSVIHIADVNGARIAAFNTRGVPSASSFGMGNNGLLFFGDEEGCLFVYDHSKKGITHSLRTSRGKVYRVASTEEGLLASFFDGSICLYTNLSDVCPKLEFSGADCDPIYDFGVNKRQIISGCRDNFIRVHTF